MKRLALWAGVVAAAMCFGGPAFAQGAAGGAAPAGAPAGGGAGVFADVPTDHWAYDAVNQLAAEGIFTGYPDQTFGGKRALTRYEFAVAIQRMLQDVQRRIEQATANIKPPTGGATQEDIQRLQAELDRQRAEQERLRSDLDTLQRLMREFQDTLAALGADVDQLKRDVAALAERLGRVEETIAKMPKITGTVSLGARGHNLRHPRTYVGGPAPTDIDGRPLPLTRNLLESVDTVYDVDLGITARLSDVATAKVLLNAGNYLRGYLNNSISTVRPTNTNIQSTDFVTTYYAYIDAPISFGAFGASITAGKFGQQFTPYTLKLVNVDSYFYNDKTESGDYPIFGGRLNFRVGGVNLQYYAGKHDVVPYADLTSTAGYAYPTPPLFTLGGPLFIGNHTGVPAPPASTGVLDQSQGARLSFNTGFMHSAIGVTALEAVGSNSKPAWRRLRVLGADLNAQLFKGLRLSGEYAQSQWKDEFGHESSPHSSRDKRIWDARLGYGFGKIDLLGYYKFLGPDFDAPGYWGAIGRWKNPRDLEGYGGILTVPLGNRYAIDAEAARYRFIGASDTHLNHYRAGVRFALTPANRVDLGLERADYTPPTGSKAKEQYINLGFGHQFSPTASFKVLYQIIRFRVGSTGINPLQNYDANIAATQFTVRF